MFKPLFRFLSNQRIRQKREFDNTIKQGKRFTVACFSCFCLPINQDDSRLGMIISKKHCRRAVSRNRIKRLIRERFRVSQAHCRGMNIVVMLRSKAEELSDQEQSACLDNLFSQLIAHCSGSVSA